MCRFQKPVNRKYQHIILCSVINLIVNSMIEYCQTTQDMMVPSVWGSRNPDPFIEPTAGCGCVLM